jgi:hypothetical protein
MKDGFRAGIGANEFHSSGSRFRSAHIVTGSG